MTIEHSQLSASALHNSKILTFTGDPAAFTPPEVGILVECLTAPNAGKTYTTTGTTPGALRLHQGTGAPGTPATVSIGTVAADPAEVTVAISNSGTANNAILDFEFEFSGLASGGTTVPLIDAPPSAPPDPLPPTGTAALALETSSPPTLWVYSSEWAYVQLTPQFDPATSAWLAATTGTYSSPEIQAIDALITHCKTTTLDAGGTLWDALALLTITASANAADAALNLKTAAAAITPIASPTFTPRQGWQLNGTSQMLGTGIRPATVAPAASEGFVGAYLRQNKGGVDNDTCILNATDDFTSIYIEIRFDGSIRGAIHEGGTVTTPTPPASEQGANSTSLTTTQRIVALNQATEASARSTPAPPCTAALYYGAFNNDGASGSSWNSNQYAALWTGWGKGLTAAELTAFHAAVETCLDAFGAGVMP